MSNSDPDIRSTRRAQREAERAARAQRKADAARERALEAARAGGLFEDMQSTTGTAPETQTDETPEDKSSASSPLAIRTRSLLDSPRRRTYTIALAVASVILAVVTGLATWQYMEAREATAAEQQIADAPGDATDAAREIATQMFTYDHRTVDADLAAVRDRLTGDALQEFVEQSMPAVATSAKEHEASVYATVAAAAPETVTDGENVEVLVMLNRMVSTKESPEAAASASRLRLHMVEVEGKWKLGDLNSL